MGANSNIEWTTHTFNPWRGCTKVSEGCKFCYAEVLSKRNPNTLGEWGPRGRRIIAAESYWRQPIKWNAAAAQAGERHRVFCASLADVFEGPETMPAYSWPLVVEARERLFWMIDETPALDWLLLTKRPENIRRFWPEKGSYAANSYRANVWRMTSVEHQDAANKRIPELIATNDLSPIAGLSCESLLGPVDLGAVAYPIGLPLGAAIEGIQWVIVGGESGASARPMHPAWARSLRDQCSAAGVAFHFKQWGEYETRIWPYSPNREPYEQQIRVGKKAAGRVLDGVEHNEVPQ